MFIAIKGTLEPSAALYGGGAKSHKAARSVGIHVLGKVLRDFRDNVIVALPDWRSLLADFAQLDVILEAREQIRRNQTGEKERMHGDHCPYS